MLLCAIASSFLWRGALDSLRRIRQEAIGRQDATGDRDMVEASVQRVNMVDSQVRPSDVTDNRIIKAMLEVPRDRFVPEARRALAYADTNVPLGAGGRVLLAPRVLAKLIQLGSADDEASVLVIGCGTGYSAAVLSRILKSVTALESDAGLSEAAKGNLEGSGVDVVSGPLAEGYAPGGPYDVILVDGAVSQVPDSLMDQLKEGGRLVAIHVDGQVSRACTWRRSGRSFSMVPAFDAMAPGLAEFAAEPAFAL